MRHGSTNRRQRNRGNNNGGRGNDNRMQVFDSNGPDVRIRGTAHQVTEKYLALAKDAASAGDRIMAESYLQHAEHYQRVINAWSENNAHQRRPAPVAEEQDRSEDDLSMPNSILGPSVQIKSQTASERTSEVAAE